MIKTRKVFKRILLLFAVLFILTAFDNDAAAKNVYVREPAVHLRLEPSTLANVVTILGQEEKLDVVDENLSWYQVNTSNGMIGWIAKRLVTEELPLAEAMRSERQKNQILTEEIKNIKKEFAETDQYKIESDEKIAKLMEESKRLLAENEYLSSTRDVINAIVGIVIFLIGWLFGFLTGFYKKQTDNKRLEFMMSKTKSD